MSLKIGTLAKLTQTTAPTIRYYEKLERTIDGLVQACDAARARTSDHSCEAWREARR